MPEPRSALPSVAITVLAAESSEAHEGQGQDAGKDQGDCGALSDVGHVGQVKFFAHTGHDGEGEGESRTCAHGVYEALDEVVFFLGLEQGQAEDGAVGGDERQEDTQCAEQRGAELLDDHFYELYGGGDDGNVANQFEIGRTHGVEHDVDAVSAYGTDDHDEDHGQAHADSRFFFAGNTEERADAQEHAEHEIVHDSRVNEYRG